MSEFKRNPFSDELRKTPIVREIVAELNSLCLQHGVIGYHYARADMDKIRREGLVVRSGQERRAEFLRRYGHLFDPVQRERMKNKWKFFDSRQNAVRDGRIWFNFTLKALGTAGTEDLLGYYGGEVVYFPICDDPELGTLLKTLGQPLIVTCALETDELDTFIDLPWGSIWLSSYHVTVNPEAMERRLDLDAYQERSVAPEQIISVGVWDGRRSYGLV